MDTQMIGQIIQFIVAPVVMISSCALILNGLLARYGAINDRLRLMTHERLELLRTDKNDPLTAERVSEIDRQIPILLHRHKQLHDAVLLTSELVASAVVHGRPDVEVSVIDGDGRGVPGSGSSSSSWGATPITGTRATGTSRAG